MLAAGAALPLAARAAAAQAACDAQPIRSIQISTAWLPPVEEVPLPAWVRRLSRALHHRTRESTVRHELLFTEGEPCEALRLEESARILRAHGYLRSAEIFATPAVDSGVDVRVLARDDWSLRASVSVHGGDVRRFRLAEENIAGRGIRLQARYVNFPFANHPGFEVGVFHHQVFGHHDAELLLGTSIVGPMAEQSVLRPFESEFDRTAWREAARYRKEPFFFRSTALGTVAQPLVSFGGDVGIAMRFGAPGRLRIVGVALSGERLYIEGRPFSVEPANDSAAVAALAGRFTERRRVRAHLLLGARRLRFLKHGGLDAVNALEDIRYGVEAGLTLGRTLASGGGRQHDTFTAAELFVGRPVGGRWLVFARGKAEARYLEEERRWDGVIAAGDLVTYHAVSERGVVVVGLSGAGGWDTSTPFQLLLAGSSGIRGYGYSGLPVGRRVVAEAEHRYFLGTAFRAVDVGTVAFVDLARGWADPAPFGEDIAFAGSVGGGLRLAFPSGSRVTYRLDLAVPLTRRGGFEVRLGLRQQFGILRGEAEDVTRSREQVSSVTVFNFPRY